MTSTWLEPDWPALPGVRAAFTLRRGGVSQAPWDSLNLGAHVGDDPAHVHANRRRVCERLSLPAEPCWLEQVHGTRMVEATAGWQVPRADAIWTRQTGRVCAVMVADCLPVLLRDTTGQCVVAIHAGWRGLAAGIIEQSLQMLAQSHGGARWQAWLGPCIGPAAFEVGPDVRAAFIQRWAHSQEAFAAKGEGRWFADLPRLARIQLAQCGVDEIWGGRWCTHSDAQSFFSYRRDSVTGRMAALIWRTSDKPSSLA